MSPRDHIERHARRVPGGGIAWECSIFHRLGEQVATACVDAAVDLAWDYLMPTSTLEFPQLDIRQEGALLIMRMDARRMEPELALAA